MAEMTKKSRAAKTKEKPKGSNKVRKVKKINIVKEEASVPKNTAIKSRNDIDYTFLFLIMLTLSLGLVMLLSASAPAASTKFNDSYYFFKRQIVFVVIGLIGLVIISRIDYQKYKKLSRPAFAICAFLLLLVAIPGVGVKLNGSRRWLQMPGFQLQPSEFMKLAIGMCFADLISTEKYNLAKAKDLGIFIIYIAIAAGLMLAEPHLSGTIVIVGVAVWIMISSGTPIGPFAVAAPIVGVLGYTVIYFFDPGRLARLMRFLNPFEDMQKSGYQISQALYAMGSGGIFGRGIGQSIQKYSYLPEPYNDFIFAIACEELGLIGAAIIIAIFVCLILRGFRIALNAPDKYSSLLATGIMAQITIQTTMNIAVATSTVPNTGVSLPFFSYGGTAIMVLLFEMGIMLNISRHQIPRE